MKRKDSPKTKLKILKAAEKLFAEKGFDGARVDDIAARAGVNKALIYYYFKSKRDVLDQLCNSLIEDMTKMTFDSIEDGLESVMDGALTESPVDLEQMIEIFYEFMNSRKDTIRIMMMESLKDTGEKPLLFKFSEIAIGDEADRLRDIYRSKGIDVDKIDEAEAIIADFFTAIMPLVGFVVFHDEWCKYFDIDEEELKKKFLFVFQTTHLAYHRVQLERIK